MPPPPIIVPLPHANHVKDFKDREATTCLKLHVLMAQFRMAVRALLTAEDVEKKQRIAHCLRAELISVFFILQEAPLMHLLCSKQVITYHMGIIQLHGFNIATPYVLLDVSDAMDLLTDTTNLQQSMHACAVNQEFNRLEDDIILATTRPYNYWWTSDSEPEVHIVELMQVMENHFIDFFNTISPIVF